MSDFIPITELPSKCLTYGEGINPGDIQIRSYRGGDEFFLSQINPTNLEKNYLEVLKRVIKGIDPLELTLGDRLYIMIWEYINSYTRYTKVKTVCSECFKDVEISVNLADLNSITLPDSFSQPYSVQLPISKEEVNLRLLTVGDELDIDRYTRKHPDEDSFSYRFAHSLVGDQDLMAKVKKIKDMDAKDAMRIVAFHEKFYHGPELSTKFTCPHCEEEGEVDVPFRLDIFYPSVEVIEDTFGEGI